jgi:hypothetical protein
MRLNRAFRLSTFAAALLTGGLAAAQDARPLAQSIDRSVRDCRASAQVTMPVITWGADAVTVHANGGSTTARDSLLGQAGANIRLVRMDEFPKQVESYLKCDTPYLRATAGMAAQAADVTEADPRTRMVAIYKHSWSNGGDALVVREGIARPADLKGKTISVQSYGPHVDYLLTILRDAGLGPRDVTIRWTRDLVGFEGQTPGRALRGQGVDAAMVIIPDALALTSGGSVGTGSETSVRGARVLLLTKTASRVISDVIFVRSDYLTANRQQVQSVVQSLFRAEEQSREALRAQGANRSRFLSQSAAVLLDSAQAVDDMAALWADAETVGWRGNVAYFTEQQNPRAFTRVIGDAQSSLVQAGLIQRIHEIAWAQWSLGDLTAGLKDTSGVTAPRFNEAAVSQAVTRMQAQGTLKDGTLYEFEINFQPNQTAFPSDLYRSQFERVVDVAATYGGAVITVVGHADPMEYLRLIRSNGSAEVLTRQIQSGRNLSLQRSIAVRDSVISMASQRNVPMDPTQFVTLGAGYTDPKTGLCKDQGRDLPCAPRNEQEWRSNMRVVFKVVRVEAEADVFRPLD